MKEYSVIAFDLDGTLSDPQVGQLTGFEYAFKKHGIAYPSREYLKKYIGPPIHDVWMSDYGLSAEGAEKLIETYREYYTVYGWRENTMYPGIEEMLNTLKENGKILVLATSKPETSAKKILRLFNIDGYFDFIGGASSGRERHRKEDVLKYALDTVGADYSSSIIVGDRMYDAEGARICGIDSVGVLWGHGGHEELSQSGFTFIVKDTEELLRKLIK